MASGGCVLALRKQPTHAPRDLAFSISQVVKELSHCRTDFLVTHGKHLFFSPSVPHFSRISHLLQHLAVGRLGVDGRQGFTLIVAMPKNATISMKADTLCCRQNQIHTNTHAPDFRGAVQGKSSTRWGRS